MKGGQVFLVVVFFALMMLTITYMLAEGIDRVTKTSIHSMYDDDLQIYEQYYL